MRIVASAPGKIVVTGEYAVLVGAPALAVAIDRRVRCSIRDATAPGWAFTTHGFAPDVTHQLSALLDGHLLPRTDPAHLCQHAVRHMRLVGERVDALGENLRVDIDSGAGFDGGRKLGIGTSAAVCSALCAALLKRSASALIIF